MVLIILQGTDSEQDSRFFNKEQKLLKSLKVPENIDTKVSELERYKDLTK